ncbi:carbohydrate ABC transporter permease [Aestuariimicrobium soli]|uniref:carbohydrate ABC transporter permease n=1 Tax=Aestuariimicrobium soli TaxID=2035834 RepID=UPI003EBFFE62
MSDAVRGAAVTAAPRRRRRNRWTLDRITFMAAFLGVPLAIYVIFVVSPFVQAIGYSFTNWGGYSKKMDFVGLANYQRVLTDDIFLKAMGNNFFFALVLPICVIVLALALATVITVAGRSVGQTRGLRGAGLYRVVSFFPYAIPAVVVGLMWSLIFDPNGLVNGLLTWLGLSSFDDFAWLGEVSTAKAVTTFVIMWGYIGFYMILFIAAIKGIPAEIYEAARIDGASRLRTAVSITLPLIRENVQTAFIYLGIAALDLYVYVAVLNPFGGPDNSTLTMAQVLLNTAFGKNLFGVACAMGVVIGLLTMLFAAIVFAINRLAGGKDQVTMA